MSPLVDCPVARPRAGAVNGRPRQLQSRLVTAGNRGVESRNTPAVKRASTMLHSAGEPGDDCHSTEGAIRMSET